MNYRFSTLLAAIGLLTIQYAAGKSITFACAGSTIALLDSTEAAIVSARPDTYTREHTSFDLAVRLNKAPGEATEAEYLQAAAANVRSWSAEEQAALRREFAAIEAAATANGLNLHLPDTVKMIRTTAAEEFGAEGYTRENRIMLNTSVQPISTHLVAHELWHVISRGNAALRNRAYAAFHFKPCNNIVYKPAFDNQVVTNPDCPFLAHYVTLEKDGRQQDMALIFYMKGQGLALGLLALTGDDRHKEPLLKDGKAVVYELDDVPDLVKKVGKNTDYMLHVEEIAAEHFAALMTGKQFPEMDYVAAVKSALTK
jgi:hypothetical protein